MILHIMWSGKSLQLICIFAVGSVSSVNCVQSAFSPSVLLWYVVMLIVVMMGKWSDDSAC